MGAVTAIDKVPKTAPKTALKNTILSYLRRWYGLTDDLRPWAALPFTTQTVAKALAPAFSIRTSRFRFNSPVQPWMYAIFIARIRTRPICHS